jgi:4-amino-4-deoxy-L-arabinose transferase-like glycosyltransferase
MKQTMPRKINILALCLIIILALGIRIGIIAAVPKVSFGPHQVYHGEVARNLVAGRGFVVDEEYVNSILKIVNEKNIVPDIEDIKPPEHEMFTNYYLTAPGTDVLLAGTYWLFGEYRFIYLRILQAIIDSFGCIFLFLIGKELFNRRIGLISAFLYAVWLPIAYISTWPHHDALMPFITLVSFYFFVLAVRKKSVSFFVISGLVAGIGCYFQATLLLLPVMFGIGLFIYGLRETNLWKNAATVAKMTALMMATLMIVLAPWIARNYVVSGDLYTGMRGELWQGIWEGFGEFDNPFGASLSDEITHQQIKQELGYDPGSFTPAAQAIFKEKVINAIKENPAWWVSTVLRRIPRTFIYFDQQELQSVPTADNVPWYSEKRWISFIVGSEFVSAFKNGVFSELIQSKPVVVLYLSSMWFFTVVPVLLSMVGIWVMRRSWRVLMLVLTLPLYFSVIHIFLFVSFHKTLLPGSLAYIILSAIALDYFYSRVKSGSISGVKYDRTLE